MGGLLAVEDLRTAHQGIYYPTYDGKGNVIGVVKAGASGTEEKAGYIYDAFGKTYLTTSHGYEDEMKFRFSTKYYDEETGFYYYGYRYYDPETGRWPNRDPINERGGVNLYGFVGNNSVDRWDLVGLDWIEEDVQILSKEEFEKDAA